MQSGQLIISLKEITIRAKAIGGLAFYTLPPIQNSSSFNCTTKWRYRLELIDFFFAHSPDARFSWYVSLEPVKVFAFTRPPKTKTDFPSVTGSTNFNCLLGNAGTFTLPLQEGELHKVSSRTGIP